MTKLLRACLLLPACALIACGAPEPAPEPEAAEAPPPASVGSIVRVDPGLDAIVPPDARIEKLAEGFAFSEGPVWDRRQSRLLFSDVRGNEVYEWSEAGGARTFIDPVYEGDRTGLRSVSSNGLTIDATGRLVLCEHGNRVISRLEDDGTRTTLVGHYEGRRLNGPNDATYASNGWLYFTDPGSGLEGRDESPLRELDYNGVYRLGPEGELELLDRDVPRPNGIALSPDESILYVANSAADDIRWMGLRHRPRRRVEPARLLRHRRPAGRRRRRRRHEGGPGGERLRDRAGRRLGDLAGGRPSRHDHDRRGDCQRGLGR